jgi:hypothetical protein
MNATTNWFIYKLKGVLKMKQYIMEVSKKENGVYVKVGDVTINYPLLSELGLSVDPSSFDAESGLPVYSDDKQQFAFDAIFAAVKASARNKLVSGTADLKEGNKIAETIEELLSSGGNNGEALKVLRDMLAAFKAWLPATVKATTVQEAIYNLVSNRKTITLQAEDKKQKLAAYLADFAGTLTTEQAASWGRHLTALDELCQTANALDDM